MFRSLGILSEGVLEHYHKEDSVILWKNLTILQPYYVQQLHFTQELGRKVTLVLF